MKERLISVVVPIYNVEKYLERSLESIKGQTYTNLEVLMIDDGSTDESALICQKFVREDKRFVLIQQENGGLSEARNTGIRISKGEYVFFVDSDDYVDHDAIKKLVEPLNKQDYDVILANGIRKCENQENKIKIIKENRGYPSGKDYMIEKIKQRTYHPAVWMNLYSTKLLKDNDLYFAKRRLHEDVEWLPRVLCKAENVYEIDECIYFYFIRANSITTKKNQRSNGEHLIMTVHDLEENVKFYNKSDERIFRDYLANLYLNGVYIGSLNKEDYSRIYPIKNAHSFNCFIKSLMFLISPKLYIYFRKRVE